MSISPRLDVTLLVLALGLSGPAASAQVAPAPDAARRAMAAAVRSDLRNLVTAQEAFFADNVHYTRALDSLRFQPSQGVAVTIELASARGWRGSGRHSAADITCWIFVGDAPKPRPDANEGEPRCEGVPAAPRGAPDSLRQALASMSPLLSSMMASTYEQMASFLARPETAERLATFTRNYYEALVRRGFTREEALRIVTAVGVLPVR